MCNVDLVLVGWQETNPTPAQLSFDHGDRATFEAQMAREVAASEWQLLAFDQSFKSRSMP